MKRSDKAAAGMLAGIEAGTAQAKTDKRIALDAAHAGAVAMMPLDAVQARAGGRDTREPTAEAVDALAESIDALGLVEPLAVDKVGRLLAGKTRLLALRRLAEKDPDRWKLVPVRRMGFDAEADPARALAVEVAENEQRRDYTAAEVRALAERLQSAGFRAKPGRPRKGTRALLPALGAVVGKSKRQLLRILEKDTGKDKPAPVTMPDAAARLGRALAAFDRMAAEVALTSMTQNERRAVRDAAKLAELLARITRKESTE
jgi:ParB family transcriptional regulator, chromosome partitioning protein